MSKPDVNSNDYYKILGIPRDATDAQIASAYKKLALKYHPDKNPKGEDTFKKVTSAYEVLRDKEKRQLYDQFGEEGLRGEKGGGFQGSTASFEHFDGIFKQFFANDSGGGVHVSFSSSGNGGPGLGGIDIQNLMGNMGMPGMGMGLPGMNMTGMGRQSARKKTRIEKTAVNLLQEGTQVLIKGLNSKPALNGKSGRIAGYAKESERYEVQVPGEAQTLSLKPTNLVVQVDRVQVTGVESKPELNGQRGRVIDFDAEKERYKVQLSCGTIVSLPLTAIIFPCGARVVIVQLQNTPQWNNQWGSVQKYDSATKRYSIELLGGKILKVKMENVRCAL